MIKKIVIVGVLLPLLFLFSACSMSNLPKGEKLASYVSPSEIYVLNIYLCDGGATVDFSIRGELEMKATGRKKNIYWNYHEKEATVEWQDDETVIINGHRLNIHTDIYDYRRNG